MRTHTDTSLFLGDSDTAEVRINPLTRSRARIELRIPGSELSICGSRGQINAIVAQFANDHAKRLTEALRLFLDMPEASDEEVQLKASLLLNEARKEVA